LCEIFHIFKITFIHWWYVHELLKQIKIHADNDEFFFIINDPITYIIMFTCKTNWSHLSQIRTIYVDRTFKYFPKQFPQFFWYSWIKRTRQFYCTSILDEAKNTHEHAFIFSCTECDKLLLKFTPQTYYADSESPQHTAIYAVSLGAIMVPWWCKIQDPKLSTFFRNDNSEIGKFLKCIFGLPFYLIIYCIFNYYYKYINYYD